MAQDPLAHCRTTHPDAQWFPDARLGLFVHWGIHSVEAVDPSWSMLTGKKWDQSGRSIPHEEYFALADRFAPEHYDPGKWLAAAAEAGVRYAVLTTRHCDGYTLWPTEHGDFGTHSHLGGRDLVAPFVAACRDHGIKVGFYYSFADWHDPRSPAAFAGYDNDKLDKIRPDSREQLVANFEGFYKIVRGQLEELLTRYGQVDLLWFDAVSWWDLSVEETRTTETIELVRALQPGIVVNNRWQGLGDYPSFECVMPTEHPAGWWEACDTTNGHWGFNKGAALPEVSWWRDMQQRCNDWGGSFLPNVGPGPDGQMPDDFYSVFSKLSEMK